MSLSSSDHASAYELLLSHKRILITPHANVDPDGLSSALACYHMFTLLGKEVTVMCPDALPESLGFLPLFNKLTNTVKDTGNVVIGIDLDEGVEIDKLRYTVEDRKVNIIVTPKSGRITQENIRFAKGESAYDLLVVVDTADLSLLGTLYTDHIDLFSSVPILNIDHHISNSSFGQINMIDPSAASATEVLYGWFKSVPRWKTAITPDIATLLLAGLITDTRSFQNPNTTPASLEVAAELLELGARQQEIIQNIYKTKPLSTLKIWGRALNAIQVDREAGIVWSSVSREDLAEMGASSKETHGLLDELISTIPDAHVYVLFTELEEGGLKASARSSTAIDISKVSGELFGGGGHARAAGFKVKAYDNFHLQVLECIQKLKRAVQGALAELPAEPDAHASSVAAAPDRVSPTKLKQTVVGIDVVSGLGSDASGASKSTDDIVGGLR